VETSTRPCPPTHLVSALKHAEFLGVAAGVPEDDVALAPNMFPTCSPHNACHPRCKRAAQKTMAGRKTLLSTFQLST